MVEIRSPIQINEAVELVMERANKLNNLTIPLQESYGFILAESIMAKHDVPPFNRSSYDGFAIYSKDSKWANDKERIFFKIVDQIGAGQVAKTAIQANEAVRIMTGAQMPKNTDAVVMLEQAVESGTTFSIARSFKPMENVSQRGEDAKQGEVLLPSGSYINPGAIALMATYGYTHIKVARKPVVGVLATGSELLNIGDDLQQGKIRDSNGPMLVAQLKRMGIESRVYGILQDDLEGCYKIIKQAITETDCLVTTGGVSVGDFDFLPEIYQMLGAEVFFNKIAIRPGSVTTVASVDNKLLFGLSGNPSSCYTGFELLVSPALLKMMGSKKCYLPKTQAILTEDFIEPNSFSRFLRSNYSFDGEKLTVTSTGFNGPNAVTAIALGNSFIVLPAGENYKAGDQVDVLLLGVEVGAEEWAF